MSLVRNRVFRVLGGLVGTGFIVVGVPAALHFKGGFWPQWVHVAAMISLGAVFLVFAITGRAWPSSYGQDVFKNDDELK